MSPIWRPNEAGYQKAEVLESCPQIAFLKSQEPANVSLEVLDLAFATVALVVRMRLSVDNTATSDHYVVVTTIFDAGLAPMPRHNL